MYRDSRYAGNVVLLRGAALALLTALVLAWCLVGMKFEAPGFPALFQGKISRLLQAHLDFLLMGALLFGFHAARVPLSGPVRWAMVIGAFTNPSLFLMQAMFPVLDTPVPAEGEFPAAFRLFALASILLTSFGFGMGAVTLLRSTAGEG